MIARFGIALDTRAYWIVKITDGRSSINAYVSRTLLTVGLTSVWLFAVNLHNQHHLRLMIDDQCK